MIKGVKGVTQIDWILSLGFFMLYLAWFFFFIQQFVQESETADTFLTLVQDGIAENAHESVDRVPVIARSNISGSELIFMEFPLSWTNFSFQDNTTFLFDDGRLFFTLDLTAGNNNKFLVQSSEGYEHTVETRDIDATTEGVSVNGAAFAGVFKDGVLVEAFHESTRRVADYNVTLDNAALDGTAETTQHFYYGKWKVATPTFSHSTYVFADFGRTYNFLQLSDTIGHNVTVSAILLNYSHYYVDGSANGVLDYENPGCTSRQATYVNFYDATDGITFIPLDESTIVFCTFDDAIQFTLTMAFANRTEYRMLLHNGNFNQTLRLETPYATDIGIVENVTGLSYRGLETLNAMSYADAKALFGIRASNDFSYFIENLSEGGTTFTYAPEQPDPKVNVFAVTHTVDVIDKYATRKAHRLRINAWE